MTREPGKCLGKVWGLYNYSPCRNKATTAKGYCKLHDPDIKKAKSDARSKKWHDKWAAQDKAYADTRAKQAELERKAALYDALEADRVGEVVLWTGEAKAGVAEFMLVKRSGDCPSVCLFPIEYSKVKHKKGSLIFREDK